MFFKAINDTFLSALNKLSAKTAPVFENASKARIPKNLRRSGRPLRSALNKLSAKNSRLRSHSFVAFRCLGSILLCLSCLIGLGCSYSDPRLPEKLYEEALALNKDGKTSEAKALMEEIVRRFPERQEGMLARQDIFMLEAWLKRASEEESRDVRYAIRITCDALKRYKDRFGEYPTSLQKLVPDYGLDRLPTTPWGHPFFYRPYVSVPREQVSDRRGRSSVRINTAFDSYHLACLGKDLAPGGEDMNADILVVNGHIIREKYLPQIPKPQPNR